MGIRGSSCHSLMPINRNRIPKERFLRPPSHTVPVTAPSSLALQAALLLATCWYRSRCPAGISPGHLVDGVLAVNQRCRRSARRHRPFGFYELEAAVQFIGFYGAAGGYRTYD